jgi:hypothetical protein
MSTMNSLGMPLESPAQMTNLLLTALQTAEPQGKYRVWTCASGAQLWIQTSEEGKLMGFTPHFQGVARARLGLVGEVTPKSYYAWADPEDDLDPTSGCYPFVFESPNQADQRVKLPSVREAQLCAFGLETNLREDKQDLKARAEWDSAMADRSCIPCGLFEPDGTDIEPPEPRAIYVGEVLDWARHTNSLTGIDFYWLRLETLGAELDVVLALDDLPREPKKGNLLSGVFHLTGLLL